MKKLSIIIIVLLTAQLAIAQSERDWPDSPFEDSEPPAKDPYDDVNYDWNWKTSGIPSAPPPPPVPIDGGLGFLLAAGAGYGLRRLQQQKRKRQDTNED